MDLDLSFAMEWVRTTMETLPPAPSLTRMKLAMSGLTPDEMDSIFTSAFDWSGFIEALAQRVGALKEIIFDMHTATQFEQCDMERIEKKIRELWPKVSLEMTVRWGMLLQSHWVSTVLTFCYQWTKASMVLLSWECLNESRYLCRIPVGYRHCSPVLQ